LKFLKLSITAILVGLYGHLIVKINILLFKYSYYNIPKRITPWCPQSKKKSDKVYGVETIKHKTEDKVYVFGSPVTVTFNGKLYNLASELEFDMLHHDLDVECTLKNLG